MGSEKFIILIDIKFCTDRHHYSLFQLFEGFKIGKKNRKNTIFRYESPTNREGNLYSVSKDIAHRKHAKGDKRNLLDHRF